uniref:KHA domain-containing protein n=1 Tax=Piliocolobus tephrosceles TaxID=591936 RepID=A0A8C9HEJ0_9PRIM
MERGEGWEEKKVGGGPGGRVAVHSGPSGGSTLRWVTAFLNGSPKNRKVVAVYGTLSDLLSVVSSKLSIKATSVYNGKGGLIDDIALIRDDDVLCVEESHLLILTQILSHLRDCQDSTQTG